MAKHYSSCRRKLALALSIALMGLSGGQSYAAEPVSDPMLLQGKNQIEIERSLQQFLRVSIPKDKKTLDAWVEQSVAYASVERLAGHEDAALDLLERCADHCAIALTQPNWQSTKSWACKRKRFVFCR